MADGDRQAGFGSQRGQLALPDSVAVAVGAPGVRGDQQPGGPGIVAVAAGLPPAADRLDGEGGGVVVDADVDPAGVSGDVVDPVRDRLLNIRSAEEEVVVLDLHRIALGAPLASGHGQAPELFALLGVHADHRLACPLVLLGLFVEVAELGVTVGMLSAFQDLGVGLQAEAGLQQPAHRRCGDRMPLLGQLLGQVAQRLRRPAQWGFRIATLVRLNQGHQCVHQGGVDLLGRFVASAFGTDASAGQRPGVGFQFRDPPAHGGLADGRCPGCGAYPAVAQQPCLGRHRQTLLPLVQMWQQHRETVVELGQHLLRDRHTRPTSRWP